MVKNMPEPQISSLDREDPLEEEMRIHSNILAWKISWTEEPGGLQFMGYQRVQHNWTTEHACIHANVVNGRRNIVLLNCKVCHLTSPSTILSHLLNSSDTPDSPLFLEYARCNPTIGPFHWLLLPVPKIHGFKYLTYYFHVCMFFSINTAVLILY